MIGQSPQDFLIRYRMSKATSLLTSTSLSIGDISVQVGYPNQLHFSRAFRNIYGMSPRQYRQQNKLLS
jgi:AraC-like DNA-binding protein